MTVWEYMHRVMFYRGMSVTHLGRGVVPITHVVDEAAYLLRWLPSSWPPSLDQPILLRPGATDVFLSLSLHTKQQQQIFNTDVVCGRYKVKQCSELLHHFV